MDFEISNIFSTSDLCADYIQSPVPNGVLVVTFTERGNRNLAGLGFGSQFLLKYGFDVVAIKTNVDIWYENLSYDLINKIVMYTSNLSRDYSKKIAYGSSMGGYAAIKFASFFDIDCVLSISPIYDIKDPFDTRWRNDAIHLTEGMMMGLEYISKKTSYCFIYDPLTKDNYHMDRYKKIIPSENLSILSVKYSGHPSGPHLRDIGALPQIVLHAFKSYRLSENLIEFKNRKRDSSSYIFNLSASCLGHRKIRWAESLCNVLLKKHPSNAEYHMLFCRILEKKMDFDKAIAACARAAVLNPANVNFSMYRDILVKKQLKSFGFTAP